ncbi:LOW QUALITY PROTEIN: uncharacterized protein LOC108110552 [Drosophila eugracilis]|uniref:LOW QUALITY PROTEIN: uncharacterized protein LOC108110552 n=1 Tax=Drosophila eugracilis TaxID=29029 RepID=UPI001BDA3135|nr:LOW QUALITY PROTEIN: uncharacterized protein LOC108110552 [Drosophila eugracilis]
MSGKSLHLFRKINSVRWYRGMSHVQMKACDDLLHALRDDMEQGSLYRVRRCISQLGLHPMVGSAQIKIIMALSQGNDLAFLWFLWEFIYKSPQKHRKENEDSDQDPITYTLNEQLLLSGIAHLDIPATLRALDALLPPATQSTKTTIKRTQKSSSIRVQSSGPKDRLQPYLSPLVRPCAFTPKIKPRLPESKLHFPEYSYYSDRMQQIPNERSRWFAQHQLNPVKRVVHELLKEELNKLKLVQRDNSYKDNNPMCETHRFLKGEMQTQQQEKISSIFQRCLSQLNDSKVKLKARRTLLEDMEKNIQCAADKIGIQSRRPFSQIKGTRIEGGTCRSCNNMGYSPRKDIKKKSELRILLGDEESPTVNLLDPAKDNVLKVMLMQKNEPHLCGAGDCRILGVDCALKESKVILENPKVVASEKDIIGDSPHLPTNNFKNLADLIPACSRTLRSLRRSTTLHPESETFTKRICDGLQLDYHKIFDLPKPTEEQLPWEDDSLDLEDKRPMIKKLCIDALKNGDTKSVKEVKEDKSLPSVLRAAANCAVNMFRKNVLEVREDKVDNSQQILIDPDNEEQIENLLKEALAVLRCNPHFVLATFTNAHKMPVLLDWVADRYGKTFSRDDMQDLVKSSYNVYKSVYHSKREQHRKMLRIKKNVMSFGDLINYASYKEFMCLVRQKKAEYHTKLDDLAMEQSRLTWLALRGYSHMGSEMKDCFFAYMPARQQDIKRLRVWRSNEYRDLVKLRLRTRLSK